MKGGGIVTAEGIALFDTAIGRCGIAWSGDRVAAVQLPERSVTGTRQRLLRRHPSAGEQEPPPAIATAIDRLKSALAGEPASLAEVALDLDRIPAFDGQVYALARSIPPGRVRTYGEIAAEIGAPGAAREVGAALSRNPFPLIVPCHRVVAAGGKLGGFSAAGGAITKRRLLEIEGARSDPGPDLFDTQTR